MSVTILSIRIILMAKFPNAEALQNVYDIFLLCWYYWKF